jgi:hypothetical protein
MGVFQYWGWSGGSSPVVGVAGWEWSSVGGDRVGPVPYSGCPGRSGPVLGVTGCGPVLGVTGWLWLDTGDTQKSLRLPPNHFFLTQTVFYYLLAPRSDICPGGRNSWHPDQELCVRLTPRHCFTVLLLRITPALLLSWLSGCPMLAIAFSWSRWYAVPSARGNVTCKNAIFQLHDLVFFPTDVSRRSKANSGTGVVNMNCIFFFRGFVFCFVFLLAPNVHGPPHCTQRDW